MPDPKQEVLEIRMNSGVQIGAEMFTGLSVKKNGAGMEITQFGVVVRFTKTPEPVLIPWPNISMVKMAR